MDYSDLVINAYIDEIITKEQRKEIEFHSQKLNEEQMEKYLQNYISKKYIEQNKKEYNHKSKRKNQKEPNPMLSVGDVEKMLDEFVGIGNISGIKEIIENTGRYEFHERLGMGGMGVVYKVYDRNFEETVALKFPHSNAPLHTERFLGDARTALKIEHPNIVRIYNVLQKPYPHYTMEYIKGQTLAKTIFKNLSIKSIINIVFKIALALEHAHKKGIIHRDVKPSNIILTKDWEPKLLDFGIAKMVESDISVTGHIIGTPQYMSPEHICPKNKSIYNIDARSDVFSLGVTFYEMLTGKTPFEAKSLAAILNLILNEEFLEPKKIVPNIPVK